MLMYVQSAPVQQSLRPARWWYAISGVLLVVAIVCAALAVAGAGALGDKVDGFQRVQVPGQATVTFSSPGSYLIYFEGPGFDRARTTARVVVGLQDQSSQQRVLPKALTHSAESYSVNGHSGLAVATVAIPAAGRYEMAAGSPAGSPVPADIAVGPGIGSNIGSLIAPLLGTIIALIASLLTWLIPFLRRRSARRALALAPAGMPAPAYGGQFAGPPPNGQYPPPYRQQPAPPPYGQHPGPPPYGQQQAAPPPYGQFPGPAVPPG